MDVLARLRCLIAFLFVKTLICIIYYVLDNFSLHVYDSNFVYASLVSTLIYLF